jgi:hemerythrin superfamily protein
MDPYELLKADHETVSKLFKRIEAASGRIKLIRFRKLKHELDVHAHVEETIFYPALKNQDESRDITLEAYEEHKVVKDLLTELAGAKKPTDEWDAKLTVLKENVEHHVEEEEGELFKKAKDVLTTEQTEALGDQMAAEKERQGAPVSEEVKKPGLIKTVVNAIFGGSGKKKTSTKQPTKKPAPAKAAKRRSTRKAAGKKTSKRASKKAGKTTTATAKKPARKSAPKKAASRAKAA